MKIREIRKENSCCRLGGVLNLNRVAREGFINRVTLSSVLK